MRLAPTEEIREVVLRIQALDRELAKAPVRVLLPGERALEQLRRNAEEEQFREEAGDRAAKRRDARNWRRMGWATSPQLNSWRRPSRGAWGPDRTRAEQESSATRRAAAAELEELHQRLGRLRRARGETLPS
ncbi:hypothetical protein ADK97_24135 [Streptomyces sp. H021]|nr:hypothetical protein ADK97_24135 [Streptomyces sp. H021]